MTKQTDNAAGKGTPPPACWTPDVTTIIQMRANFNFLMDCIEEIHDALCPEKCGTWQMRAEQAVAAAKALASNS